MIQKQFEGTLTKMKMRDFCKWAWCFKSQGNYFKGNNME